ncbi:PREDICTED: probable basic-leucine zipper transcription factor Q [Vollenhovia emeryi]|uniref:probable basic-leucine zipper transcription factor Q n=1 Tax=Vollenhovia emeryi TaxID=411798 RepID=UPI0005F3CAF9|nr:PREDICTED: probable basic-leucine zipper transcription factor Q [Vollenhovia emeryi]
MTESGVPRMKGRNGARLFKNPPQPHMCIQDFIQGTTAPCYVNVLSWDKIAMPRRPSLPVPLYGGMRVPPPRTKTEAIVFAVMANPEVLRMSGKNAQDAKKRTSFIELLLDFIEAMNAGVVFNRNYTILKDRDITGELKEVWNAVLAIRDNEQRPPQQETWIDVQPPMSQYPQYPEQQQQQQEYIPQPPQYHSSVAYSRTINNENMHYESYGHQPQNSPISKNEPIFIPGHSFVSQQCHNSVHRIALDRYNYRERGRDGQVVQNIISPQHQFQPRQTWPQYVNTKYMPGSNLPYGPGPNTTPAINPPNQMKPFQPYPAYQQQQQQQQQQQPTPPPPPLPHMDNTMHVDIRRMQQQPQQSQIHFNHVQPQYAEQSGPFNVQNNAHRASRPHMGVAQKNNVTKRQANSPTHISCTNCQNKEDQSITKPKSPVKVLQREMPTERQDTTNHVECNKAPAEKTEEPKIVPVTNLDEDLKKSDELVVEYVYSEKEYPYVCSSEVARTVDEAPPCEEKNSAKVESCTMSSMETKETEVTSATQQLTVLKNANKFVRGNARTRRTQPATKGDNYSENPKRSQPTMNSIFKNVFKMNPGASSEESSGKKKANGQARPANGKAMCENEEQVQQGYTILKKEAQEEMVSEIAQLSIQDCKDAAEVAPVLS